MLEYYAKRDRGIIADMVEECIISRQKYMYYIFSFICLKLYIKCDIIQIINADSEEDLEMISSTNIPIMQKAVNVIYDMSEDTKIREIARMREKALHDEASAIKNAKAEGREEGRAEERAEAKRKMQALGFTDEQIRLIYSD